MSSVSSQSNPVGSHPKDGDSCQLLCQRCSQKTEKLLTDETNSYCSKCEKSHQSCDEDADYESSFPEGGWGWVIVVASFFNSFIFDGIGSGFGVLYPYVHETFQASAFLTSFAGSMFAAYLTMGSVAALLIKRFGFRAVSFTGGLLSCIALVMASRTSNIYMFQLTYGVMGGASIGLVYLPSMVIVNGYFNKRRGITNGIISSGSGMGLLVMAPIMNALLDHYSLSGAVLILAGVLLNICVFSSCFRQPRIYSDNTRDSDGGSPEKEAAHLLNDESNSDDNTEESMIDNDLGCVQHVIEEQNIDVDGVDKPNSKTMGVGPALKPEKEMPSVVITESPERQTETNASKPYLSKQVGDFLFRELKTNVSQSTGKLTIDNGVADNSWMRSLNLLPADKELAKLQINHRKHPSQHSIKILTDIGANSYLTRSISQLVQYHNHHFPSVHQLHTTSHENCRSLSTTPTNIANGPIRHEMLLSSSTNEKGEGLPKNTEHFTSRGDLNQDDIVGTKSNDSLHSIEIFSETAGYSLSQLSKMGSFYLFTLGACFIQLGYPIPNIFLSDLAATHGISRHHGAVMISLIGSFNIAGRLLGGALANFNFNPIQLNDIALFFGAILCFMCPLFTTLWSLCIFSALYGFLLGFFPPLQPVIIVKYFGIKSLASTFGLVTSLKGVAGLIGPPLAGWIYDVTLDYSISIVFAGVVFMLSVIVNELLVYTTKRDLRRREEIVS